MAERVLSAYDADRLRKRVAKLRMRAYNWGVMAGDPTTAWTEAQALASIDRLHLEIVDIIDNLEVQT